MTNAERAAELLKLDLFAVLGVSPKATDEDIRKGYLTAVKQFHPDRAPSDDLRPAYTKAFARIELAKATLGDPLRRARYADELARPGANAGSDRSAAAAAFEHAKAASYVKTNDLTRAEQHARKAVELAPENVEYAVALVSIRTTTTATPAQLGDLAVELDRLIKKSPDSERALLQRGQIRKRLGREREAMADFARVVALNPANIDAERELRIHKMRANAPAPSEPGAMGFFRGLFKKR